MAMVLAVPVISNALTSDDVQAKILTLQAQIDSARAKTVAVGQSCYQFTTLVKQGQSGIDVRTLQAILVKQGFDVGEDELNNGYFGDSTFVSVQAFQAKNGIRQAGYVGIGTRAALNLLTGCSNAPAIPVSVDYEKFTSCLSNQGVIVYTHSQSEGSQKLRELFGTAWNYLPTIDCSINTGQCATVPVVNFPAFVDGNGKKLVEGSTNLSEIAVKTSCSLKGDDVANTAFYVRPYVPAKGEKLYAGRTYTVRFIALFQNENTPFEIDLVNVKDGTNVARRLASMTAVLGECKKCSKDQNLDVTIPIDTEPGDYFIRVVMGDIIAEGKTSTFKVLKDENKVKADEASTQFKILSPAAGASVQVGNSYAISWKNATGIMKVYVQGAGIGDEGYITTVSASDNSYTWNVREYSQARYGSTFNLKFVDLDGSIVGYSDSFVIFAKSTRPPAETTATLSAKFNGLREDRAGFYDNFGPGKGFYNSNPSDWNWLVTLALPTEKSIQSMTVYHNTPSEVWSTRAIDPLYNKKPYPLLIYADEIGKTIKKSGGYDKLNGLNNVVGTNSYKLYGQPEWNEWRGGRMEVVFTDSTMMSVVVPTTTATTTFTTAITVIATSTSALASTTATSTSSLNSGTMPATQPGRAPAISGLEGPAEIASGEPAKWTIAGSDPDGTQISFKADYGDGTVQVVNASGGTGDAGISKEFTNIYERAGTYRVTFTLTDSSGSSASKTVKLVVTEAPSGFMKISTLSTPASWAVSSLQKIEWTASGFQPTDKFIIDLLANGVYDRRIATSVAAVVNSIDWVVPYDLQPNIRFSIRMTSVDGSKASVGTISYFSIPVPVAKSISASAINSHDNRAGVWGVFTGGKGYQNPTADDWTVSAVITLSGPKTIKAMHMFANNGDEWSTSDAQAYPLVVVKDGVQMNTSYGKPTDFGMYPAGNHRFVLFAQMESSPLANGLLRVDFTDGTSISGSVGGLASVITPDLPIVPVQKMEMAPMIDAMQVLLDSIKKNAKIVK